MVWDDYSSVRGRITPWSSVIIYRRATSIIVGAAVVAFLAIPIFVTGGGALSFVPLALLCLLMPMLWTLDRARATLWRQANEDPLTGLPNRRQLIDHLDTLAAAGRRGALLFVDLDRFKAINDSLGHRSGDELLMQVAQRLTTLLDPDDMLARIGGDEFVVVTTTHADTPSADALARRIIGAVEQPFELGGFHAAHIGASVGIRLLDGQPDDGDSILIDADLALYEAKTAGRGRSSHFRPEMKQAVRDRLALDARMRQALDRGEFELAYQPIVRMESRSIVAAEALVRWRDPARGVVGPSEFIALAEETGFIEPLSVWILDAAFRQMAAWRKAGLNLDAVTINLSFRHFQRAGLIEQLQVLISTYDIPPQSITLEITESMVLEDERDVNIRLSELCGMGFRIALDDFGTGYSCLSVLRHLPLHKLKIDRSFLADVPFDPIANKVVSGIVALAKSLELEVVVEGIETDAQLLLLQTLGCEYGQGYLLGRPMSGADLEAEIRRQQGRAALDVA